MVAYLRYDEEHFYWDPISGDKHLLPSLSSPASLYLSVIVPSYNEQDRLPLMLDEALAYLQGRSEEKPEFTWEVIVVDDGSKDRTARVGWEYSRKWGSEKVRVLKLARNRGKGGAVRLGMVSARGRHLLMADADGATKFSDVDKLDAKLLEAEQEAGTLDGNQDHPQSADDVEAIAIGSRAYLEKQSIATRSLFRTILMYGFHALVWLFAVRSIADTQCGFKLFTRPAARRLFNRLHVEGWAFDAEVLMMAEHWKMRLFELAVTWHEVDGSKITPVWSYLEMGRDLVMVWLRYCVGVWTFDEGIKEEEGYMKAGDGEDEKKVEARRDKDD